MYVNQFLTYCLQLLRLNYCLSKVLQILSSSNVLCYNLLSYFQFTTKSGNANVHVTFLLMVVIKVQKCFDFIVLEENKLGKMGVFFSVTRLLVFG